MGSCAEPRMRLRDCSRATPVEALTACPATEESEPSMRTRTVAVAPFWS